MRITHTRVNYCVPQVSGLEPFLFIQYMLLLGNIFKEMSIYFNIVIVIPVITKVTVL